MGRGRGRRRARRRGKPLGVFPAHCLFFCFQLRAAEVEIKDLQSEFELEKIDYLATIRRQERDFLLFQQLLEQVQPLIRRDCNYSNLEKIRRESCWDEDNGFWKIPEPIIIKTSLPAGQGLCCRCPPPLPPALLHSLLSHRLTGGALHPSQVALTLTLGTQNVGGLSQTHVGWSFGSSSRCQLLGLSVFICEMGINNGTFLKDRWVA